MEKRLVPQQSTVWTRRQQAVCVRRAVKAYGQRGAAHVILDQLNMTVPKGCIYGLLGASGCGKTTLLSCIVGRRRLDSGEIWVLGGKPGSRGSGVPGPRIGYMPQEIALYGEFSIRETLIYFGWVAGKTTAEVDQEIDFLMKLLLLPDRNRAVKALSGGQQRRVSLAAAMLHKPELLILDEPTVGVDPLIRQAIWDYLVEITKNKSTTVIITTHYIDETKQAHTIGLMRGGRFLAEESPAALLQRYGTDSLEDIFLKLSLLQNRGKRRRSSILTDIVAANATTMPELNEDVAEVDAHSEISGEFGDNMSLRRGSRGSVALPPDTKTAEPLPPDDEKDWSWREITPFKSHHMKALIWKNTLWMWRNVATMVFMFTIPILQTILFCLSIGRDPVGLKLGVVNFEVPSGCPTYSNSLNCSYTDLSCDYLHFISNRGHDIVRFSSEVDAEAAVIAGATWGFLIIPQKFSPSVNKRIELGRYANDSILEGSEISVRMDMSNNQISYLLKKDIVLSLGDFARSFAKKCNENPAAIEYPVRFNHPIYGPAQPNFTDFAAPGVILTIAFFLSVAMATGTMIIERNEGILERGLVSGISGFEILAGHVVTQFVNMFSQGVLVVLVALYAFGVTNEGNVFLAMLLTVLAGTCGMVFGFLVSCVADNERNATYIALGSFLPFVMLCGIIWPVEGMHSILKTISFFLPLTLTTESMRAIFARGWSIHQPTVYAGFISIGIWILIFMNATILVLKFKKG